MEDNCSNVYATTTTPFKAKLDYHYRTTLNTIDYTTTTNLNLITALDEHTITWSSSNQSVISNAGVVVRPAHTASDATVFLTAKNQANETVLYKVIVLKEEAPEPPLGPEPPTYQIEGELVDGAYVTPITITLSAAPGMRIEYFYLDGTSQNPQEVYNGPFLFDKRYGSYMFNAYAFDSANNRSEVLRFGVKMNVPYDESYNRVIRDGSPVKFKETGQEIVLQTYTERLREVRAVWVATVHNIDVPKYQNDEQYKAYLIDILETVKSLNMNTVFFQVRSMNDAFYPSIHAPYSEYIKGALGEGLVGYFRIYGY